jgi:hypothetical protein
MISIGGRSWHFPNAQIDSESEFEWRDGKLWLHESTGNVIEGTEVSEHRALAARHGLNETDLF